MRPRWSDSDPLPPNPYPTRPSRSARELTAEGLVAGRSGLPWASGYGKIGFFSARISLTFCDNSSIVNGFWMNPSQPRFNMSLA